MACRALLLLLTLRSGTSSSASPAVPSVAAERTFSPHPRSVTRLLQLNSTRSQGDVGVGAVVAGVMVRSPTVWSLEAEAVNVQVMLTMECVCNGGERVEGAPDPCPQEAFGFPCRIPLQSFSVLTFTAAPNNNSGGAFSPDSSQPFTFTADSPAAARARLRWRLSFRTTPPGARVGWEGMEVEVAVGPSCATEGGEQCALPFYNDGELHHSCLGNATCPVFRPGTDNRLRFERCGSCGTPATGPPQSISPGTPLPDCYPPSSGCESPATPAPDSDPTSLAAVTVIGACCIVCVVCCLGGFTFIYLNGTRRDTSSSDTSASQSAGAPADADPPSADWLALRSRWPERWATQQNSEANAMVDSILTHIAKVPQADVQPTWCCCVCLEAPGEQDGQTLPYGGADAEEPNDTASQEQDTTSWAAMPCSHQLHFLCLRQWLTQRATKMQQMTCPVCRAPISELLDSAGVEVDLSSFPTPRSERGGMA